MEHQDSIFQEECIQFRSSSANSLKVTMFRLLSEQQFISIRNSLKEMFYFSSQDNKKLILLVLKSKNRLKNQVIRLGQFQLSLFIQLSLLISSKGFLKTHQSLIKEESKDERLLFLPTSQKLVLQLTVLSTLLTLDFPNKKCLTRE